MKMYFGRPGIIRSLAKKLKRQVESWGDEMYLMEAQKIVVQMFGYEGMGEFNRMVGLAEESVPDQFVSAEERAARFNQYVEVLAAGDFSREEAVTIVSTISAGHWWGFDRQPSAEVSSEIDDIPASPYRMQFRDREMVGRFYSSLKKGISVSNVAPIKIGRRRLMAKLFGFDSVNEFYDCAGHGVPSVSDWYVSPEELDLRVNAYLKVLSEAGFTDEQARELLHVVGAEGWWSLERKEWEQTPRQAIHADRIEGTGTPTWRSNVRKGPPRHRATTKGAKQEIFVIMEDDWGEVVIYAEFANGKKLEGLADEALGPLLDAVDPNLRSEVASIYMEIRNVPDVATAFNIKRKAGAQVVLGLSVIAPDGPHGFLNYNNFIDQGGRQLLRQKLSVSNH
ncbi:hypothetical protein G6L29_10645 [Agrobacterium rhizogenes]|uniref:hypothetical protein n=1 Tax=Rhizobium rhizogenes TaxID=359 RepID=UPI00157160FB|nr:hypothetical protein [Rhizobium rhizogenes]NTI16093.1 hypothetical protein [Rhizobium rhizogenes]